MTALTYATFVTTLANFMVVPEADTDFQQAIPTIVNDAELRLYRDLDLLQTQVTSTGTLTTGTRIFNLPTTNGSVVVVENINVITPAGVTNPESGTRNPLWPMSIEAISMLYPSVSGSTIPTYFAMLDQERIVLGPWPAAAYTVEVQHSIRPNQLSSTQATTLLSTYYPDLLIAASMVAAAGYQKNFGSMVDDPKAAVSWETHYQTLLQAAMIEEQRKKFQGPGWSSDGPTPMATPPRT